MIKNAFYFTSKALFVLKIFEFCLYFLVVQQNGLIRKVRLISKFMTSQPGQQTIVIHILPYISRSKGNQTMKFDQLIYYNIRNIFLEKLYTKCGRESSPKPFSEKFKLSIYLDQQSKVLYNLFLLYGKLRAIDIYIETKLQTTCFCLILSFFLKQNRSGTSLPPYFLHNF